MIQINRIALSGIENGNVPACLVLMMRERFTPSRMARSLMAKGAGGTGRPDVGEAVARAVGSPPMDAQEFQGNRDFICARRVAGQLATRQTPANESGVQRLAVALPAGRLRSESGASPCASAKAGQ
jgi:hypothetical protein